MYSYFKDNIWDVYLADMQLISKYNKGIRYLLCILDLFSKYALSIPLEDKKGTSIANALQTILDNSKKKKQIKYGLIKVVKFTRVILKNG